MRSSVRGGRLALPLAASLILGSTVGAQEPSAVTVIGDPVTGPAEAELGYEPGAQRFRLLNVSGQDLDLVTRSSNGTVVAYVVRAGVPSGAATDYVGAPDPGSVVAASAGAEELTCVSTCEHFRHRQNTSFIHDDQVTILVGPTGSIELWEHQEMPSAGFYNTSIPATDPAVGTILVIAGPVTGSDIGFRLAVEGTPGCFEDPMQPGALAGTYLAIAVPVPDPAALTVHDPADADCAAEPVGGPFPVEGAPGSRTYLVLEGAPGAMTGLLVPIP